MAMKDDLAGAAGAPGRRRRAAEGAAEGAAGASGAGADAYEVEIWLKLTAVSLDKV